MQGDMLGKFTCHKFNGASTIDYAILSQSLLEDVVNFSVLPLSFFSSHCPIAFTLRTKVFKIDKSTSHFSLPKPRVFIWNNEKINQFNLFLNMESSISKVDLAIEQMSQNQFSNNSIDTVVASINEVVNDAARKCFATKNCKNNKNHHRNSRHKRWFDKDCEEAKKELLLSAKNLQRFPKDPIVRGRYHKLKKQYKRLVKDKEQAFRKKMLDSISQCEKNNPKLFWDMVNRLRSCKKKIWQITLIRRNGINSLGI